MILNFTKIVSHWLIGIQRKFSRCSQLVGQQTRTHLCEGRYVICHFTESLGLFKEHFLKTVTSLMLQTGVITFGNLYKF